MHKTLIPFSQVSQLSASDRAYAEGDARLKPFYHWEPTLSSFEAILKDRGSRTFPRREIVEALRNQYAQFPEHSAVTDNISALGAENTFTVVTAHQPSLFLGPLYFIYKAITTLKLARAVEDKYEGIRVVPVFVLGSEDHDLEELNHINLYGKQLSWNPGVGGPVGAIPSPTLETVLEALQDILGENGAALYHSVAEAYRSASDFAGATQALLHRFLGRFGLVTLNMSEPAFKRLFVPVMREELFEQSALKLVSDTIGKLQESGFKAQAQPREINLFYLQTGSRERIVSENGTYSVLNTSLRFSQEEMLAELHAHPERFSPNVILRPLFQEWILPNLAYVGGGGELAYWLERKALFEHFGMQMPMLVRRHSLLFLDKDAVKKLSRFGFSTAEYFNESEFLVRKFIAQNAATEVSLNAETSELSAIYDKIAQKALLIDPTLEKAVRADESKALAGLAQWESRLVRAEKQKHEISLNQLRGLKEKHFPGNGLQERQENILAYLNKYGESFLDQLYDAFEPFESGFIVLSEA